LWVKLIIVQQPQFLRAWKNSVIANLLVAFIPDRCRS
jgi:hypothetical protein